MKGKHVLALNVIHGFIQINHDENNYPCMKCDYKRSTKVSLTQHHQTIHEGKKYHCRDCEYQAILKRKGPHANINGPSAFLRGGSGKGQIFMLKKMDAKLRDF